MKHLKIFEEYTTKLYIPIDDEQFQQMGNMGITYFPIHVLKELSQLLGNKFDHNIPSYIVSKDVNILRININSNDIGIVIYHTEDDWFYVDDSIIDNDPYYKCDGFEGLLQLLKDKNVIE